MGEEAKIAVSVDFGVYIKSISDISDAISGSAGTAGLILREADLAPEFFDLRTGLAGELFQKFINVRKRVAIVIPDPAIHGERFSELAYEHSTHNLVRTTRSEDEAKAWLAAG
ncbi:MAG TPA: DUF4180 domain-containing protein [Blastocatellia bacterium]